MKADNKLPFHQGKRWQQYSIWARFPWERARGEVFGWGREDAFQLGALRGNVAFVYERAWEDGLCPPRRKMGKRKACLFHRRGLRVPVPWEKGLKDYRDVRAGAGEESSRWRPVRRT